jgi:hypothetical protein
MNKFLEVISYGLHRIQRTFFPDLECEAGPIPKTLIELSYILQTVHSQKVPLPERCWTGRPPASRLAILNAFIAKSFLNISTTLHLVERLQSDRHLRLICGFEAFKNVPSESVFSRVFAEFARTELPQRIHEAIVKKSCAETITGHILRDSTSIEAREKPAKRSQTEVSPRPVKRKGRPRKGEATPAKELTRIKKQMSMSLEEMLKDIPVVCNVGSKKNSQGYTESWIGYKLHIDTSDTGLPISALLTSASLHDSQVAIPLATISAGRVQNFYDLMDSAYDVSEIKEHSQRLNHVPLIDINPRGNTDLKDALESEGKARRSINWKPAEAIRYNERSGAERTNARLKDEFGGRTVRVQGAAKVSCHLMIGLLVLTVDQLMRMTT